MAQLHCLLPWLGNIHDFSKHINQHIQGCLQHRKSFRAYRTFHNTMSDRNLAIHCLILELQARLNEYGFSLETLYIIIDKVSENANKVIIGK